MNNEKIKECVKSVYIHIPFCNYICSYCDFCKMYYDENKIDKYLNALKEEIKNESTINCIYSFSSCQFHAHRWYGVFGKKRSKIMYCLGIEFFGVAFCILVYLYNGRKRTKIF